MTDQTAAPVAATQQSPSDGAQQLIAKAKEAIVGSYDLAVSQIDHMIASLQVVKNSIEEKKQAAIANMEDFIGTVDQGLQHCKTLEQAVVQKIVAKHL